MTTSAMGRTLLWPRSATCLRRCSMTKTICVVFTYFALALIGINKAQASDCPGFCIECKSAAIGLCGANCVASFSCSLNTCTCTFSCKPTCTHAPTAAVLLRDPLKLQLASLGESDGKYSPPNVHF